MKNLIKVIDYTDGGKFYNRIEVLEAKSYGVAKISFVEEGIEQYFSTVWFNLEENKYDLTESELLYIRVPIGIDELNTLTVPKLDNFISQIKLTGEVNIIIPEPRLKVDKIQAILEFEEI